MMRDGENIMLVLSSPSGVGKTTLTKKIQQKYPSFIISVSYTTRLPRSNEVDGVDYNFIGVDEFKKLIKERKFYEYAKIFNNYYGTLKSYVDGKILENDILFDIDWQGTNQLSKYNNLKLIKVFLVPESKVELKKRLINRNQNTKKELEERLDSFEQDVKKWNDYDYVLVNKNFLSIVMRLQVYFIVFFVEVQSLRIKFKIFIN